MRELLFLLLLLACPLGMFLMMRSGHGHGGHGPATSASGSDDQQLSVRELRRRRGELDRLLGEREPADSSVATGTSCQRSADSEKPAGATSTR